MKTSDRLAQRLEKIGFFSVPEDIHRCYHGHWQRSRGAWSWHASVRIRKTGLPATIGSQLSMSQLLKMTDVEIKDEISFG